MYRKNKKYKIKKLLNQFYKNYYMKQAGNDNIKIKNNINNIVKKLSKTLL